MFSFATLPHSSIFILLFKIGSLIALGIYLIFLLVILRQIRSMNTIITQPDMFPAIQGTLFILLAFTVFIFVLGVVIL